MRDHVVFYLNGERVEVRGSEAGWMLADFLRYRMGLTGTKIVCAEGDCGACTVLRRFPASARVRPTNEPLRKRYLAVNSCVALVAQLDGSSLVTVDAVAEGERLNPVQDAMAKCHGSQCGFCTPGFVMALAGVAEKRRASKRAEPLTEKEARNALTGNLCRCTGYQQILEAAANIDFARYKSVEDRFYSKAQERELVSACEEPVRITADEFDFYAPVTLKQGAAYLAKNKDAKILASATDLGVFHNKRKARLAKVLSLHLIPSLYELKETKDGIHVGARVTLEELRRFLKSRVPELAKYLNIFASPQIKNIATLAGNVANASPIADTPTALMITDAIVVAIGTRGAREIPIVDFFVDYRKTALKADEMISAIRLRAPAADERIAVYKVSARKDLDIASVNAGFWLKTDGTSGVVREARVAFGGVAAVPVRLKKTEKALVGQTLAALDIDKAALALQAEIKPISDVRGSCAFRRVLAENLLRRFAREMGVGGGPK